ncbi:MAG TPA: aminodeoxychorismate lyase [Candidatus Limnocylindrales bacterium]|nr:aminodeoxychorismate lyase [Candidatus Limnocylindrales bacterium]
MIVFLNGQFVPEEQATVSVFDRGFLYGDGLFETMLVANGKPFRWHQHLSRFLGGAHFLKLQLPFTIEQLAASADELIRRNNISEGILRLTLSRGKGPRGYSIRAADHPTVVISLHPSPNRNAGSVKAWRLITSSVRIPAADPLAAFKTSNKLPQILARCEADAAGVDEALVSNTDGWVVEGASSNLFWIQKGNVCTSPTPSGVLPGVTRAVIIELCKKLQIPTWKACIKPEQLLQTEGVFLSLSSLGIIPASELDQKPLSQSPVTEQLMAAYTKLVRAETQG